MGPISTAPRNHFRRTGNAWERSPEGTYGWRQTSSGDPTGYLVRILYYDREGRAAMSSLVVHGALRRVWSHP